MCKKEFEPTHGKQVFCCKPCMKMFHNKKRYSVNIAEKECVHCGAEFTPHCNHQICCSRQCIKAHTNQKRDRKQKPLDIIKCPICGNEFKIYV